MASLVRPWLTCYRLPDGRRVPKGTPGAHKVRTRARRWYGQLVDHTGRLTRRPLSTDKSAAALLLAEKVKQVELRKAGAADPHEDSKKQPLVAHLADYELHLRAGGVSAQYRYDTLRRLQTLIRRCGFRSLADISATAVEQFLQDLTDSGRGPSTRNSYVEAARAFLGWCVKRGRLVGDPLATVERLNESVDVRRQRRAMTEDEMRRLLRLAAERPQQERPTIAGKKLDDAGYARLGRERALIYKAAILTGLRRGELEALRVADLALDREPYTVTVQAARAKNRTTQTVALRPDLAADLRDWLSGEGRADAKALVFNVPRRLVKILRRDLQAAGIPYRDAEGRYCDVHAMRHTTATYLARAGVAPRVAQQVMRHSDLRLTMQVYTDPQLLDLAGAVEQLPDIPLGGLPDFPEAAAVALRATGTDSNLLALPLAQTSDISLHSASPVGTVSPLSALPSGESNPLENKPSDADCHPVAAGDCDVMEGGKNWALQDLNL